MKIPAKKRTALELLAAVLVVPGDAGNGQAVF